MSFGDLLHSRRWKVFMNYVYNVGASIVIVGALFKLMHWPGAGLALTIGMGLEAIIFFISSFEPIHEQPDWTRVFPELKSGYPINESAGRVAHFGGSTAPVSANVNVGGIFEQANIAPEVLEKVSKGLTDLGNTASSISDISSATLATNGYVKNLNTAAESMGQLSKMGQDANANINNSLVALSNSCARISEVVSKEVSDISMNSTQYKEKMSDLRANISLLNENYAQQASALKGQFETSQKYNQQMTELTSILHASLEGMKEYQTLSQELNNNLKALNSVYSTMLGAMNYKK